MTTYPLERALRISLCSVSEQKNGRARIADRLTSFEVSMLDADRLIDGVENDEAHRTSAGQLLSVADALRLPIYRIEHA